MPITTILRALGASAGPSQFAADFRDEQHVLPSIAGLPRIIRAFVPRAR